MRSMLMKTRNLRHRLLRNIKKLHSPYMAPYYYVITIKYKAVSV